MLTPQEISQREFTKAVFGGYDMSTVDEFIESVSSDYAALYKENAILKSKLKVLVDKIEEYRSTEDAMRMALLTAQTMGDEIISEANAKRDKMLSEAEETVKNKVGSVKEELAAEEAKLQSAKEQTARYCDAMRSMMRQQQQYLEEITKANGDVKAPEMPTEVAEPVYTEISANEIQEPAQAQPTAEDIKQEQIMDAAMEIDSAVSKLIETTPDYKAVATGDTEETKVFKKRPVYDDEDEPTSPRPKFNFDDLQFGANYDTGRIK